MSEISQIQKYLTSQKQSRKMEVVVRGWGGGWGGNKERLVRGYKLCVLRLTEPEELTKSMETIVDNTVLYN